MNRLIQELDGLKTEVQGLTDLDDRSKENLIKQVDKVISRAEVPDTLVYRVAVMSIGAAVILIALGLIGLAVLDVQKIPDALGVGLGTALGALAGMLIPTGRGGEK
jgi:hypothetical protein